MKAFFFTTLALVILPFFLASNVFAQTEPPCGNVITPANYSYEGSEEYVDPLTDCTNPFNRTSDLTTLKLNNQTVVNNTSYLIDESGTASYGLDGETFNNGSGIQYYRQQGSDYVRVNTDFESPTEQALEAEITNFFPGNTARTAYYTEIFNSPNKFSYFLVTSSPRVFRVDPFDASKRVIDVYSEMEQYVSENAKSPRKPLVPGTYTAVQIDTDEGPGSSYEPTLIQKIFAKFIPTAHAYYYVNTVTFTLAGPAPEPTGASSVLFLPGIMGSRLYEGIDVCNGGSEETELWITRSDCKQLRLATNLTGNSINNVYTKSSANSVIDEGFGFNLYKTFIANLNEWKTAGIINEYTLVPYDWRLRLDDLLKAKLDSNTGKITYNPNNTVQDGYVYKALEKLAASSTNGKVTIVAHSNGGLLAKALLANLKITNDPLLSKVDNLILVGAPQLGTPSTLLGLLHGDEIGPAGFVVSQQTTRTLMNTMPFANHLLPSSSYFNGAGVTIKTPVIIFESGTTTSPLATTFGNSITTASAQQAYLSNSSGRTKPAVDDLSEPEVVDSFLFTYSSTIHQLMDNWVAPNTMQVYQIAGVGVTTMTGLTYFTDRECATRSFLNPFKCATYKSKLGMYPNETIDGDETVLTPSALGMSESNSNVKRLWLNLKNYNQDSVFNRFHKDIFEVQDIINFVKNTIEATTSAPYLYLTETTPTFEAENRLVFDLHSPLDLSITTADGRVISSSSVTVEGAQYKRFGEMQHISMLDSSVKKTIKMIGTGTGSFTLQIGETQGQITKKRHIYSAIPSSTSTKVTIELDSIKPTEQAIVSVDYDGNGSPDITYNTYGEVVATVSYITLNNAINALNVKAIYKKLLLENAKIAEQYQQKSVAEIKFKKLEILALNVLKQQVILYERLKIFTPTQKQELVTIIDKLLNK